MEKLMKAITVISIIIIIFGFISGYLLFHEMTSNIGNEKVMIDGSDFTGLVGITGAFGAAIISAMVVGISFFVVIIIWIIYGIIYLIAKRKQNDK